MVRRNLRHLRRYPALTGSVLLQPLLFLLLFVFVFGETLGGGLPPAAAGGRDAYLAYVLPGILVMTVAGVGVGTAISVATDMTEGVVNRFRTLGIARSAVLNGHVIASLVQAAIAVTGVVGVAVALGFRATTGPVDWLAAAALLGLVTVALTWLCVGLGLHARTVETASNTPLLLILLPFLSTAFVPAESLPGPMAWFAEHQPFTPMIETVRTLLTGGGLPDAGTTALVAVLWCAVILVPSVRWSASLYEREPRPRL
jgi:ABC-2 type transport system permease protein